jgi:segregation and condensation protein A
MTDPQETDESRPKLTLVESSGVASGENRDAQPAQAEMPFAVVDGEAVTHLPQDLYIPPSALEVFLEAFEGPLDLLLYLIRRQNIDILNIPIAEITKQYAAYIDVMNDLQLELAGDYLVMAAMLAEIKSRMLLPRVHDIDEDSEEDPRAELVRRLQEYERYKRAAQDISAMPRMERDTFQASIEPGEKKVVTTMPDITLKELLVAFQEVVNRAEMFAHHHVQRETLSVRQRMSEVLARIRGVGFTEFKDLFDAEEGRLGVTVTFLALLELMKESLIDVVQSEPFAPIHVRAASTVRLVDDAAPEEPTGS